MSLERHTVAFQGSRTGRSAFALINARWGSALEDSGSFDVIDFDKSAARRADIVIHHDFETPFSEFIPPSNMMSVAVRTWDFGPLPPVWVEKVNTQYDHIWVHSRWIADQARTAGIAKSKIRVVPHGIEPTVFHPDGVKYPLPSKKRFVFLFAGGVCFRKGSDTLLKAYAEAFSAGDDVVLVIKDHSQDLFYRDDTIRATMRDIMSRSGAPEIVHIDDFLSEADLASLYRMADVAVFPYRAEGFCMPILECMAAGTPSIAPRFGACLDFCSDETSYLTSVQRIQLPVHRKFKVALGFSDDVNEVDFCEVRVADLAAQMRRAYEDPKSVRAAKARAGVAVAHNGFTWAHSTNLVQRFLSELTDGRRL